MDRTNAVKHYRAQEALARSRGTTIISLESYLQQLSIRRGEAARGALLSSFRSLGDLRGIVERARTTRGLVPQGPAYRRGSEDHASPSDQGGDGDRSEPTEELDPDLLLE